MRKRLIPCAVCLALLILLAPFARKVLPVDTRPLIAEKYNGWSGVLRLWVFEGWPAGSNGLSPWLNDCIRRFERRHSGVYIQPSFVDAGAIVSMNDSGIVCPDLVLFPPGLLDAPTGLSALTPPDGLRGSLSETGAWGDGIYAVPVAMGGYIWVRNAALLDAMPASWREADAALTAPAPEAWRHWDAALLALCASQVDRSLDGVAPADDGASGLDLGLTLQVTPAPTPSATPNANTPACRLPEGFQLDPDAWRRFVNGEAAAMPVTQSEIRRLEVLSARGKGPDWRLEQGCPFTDQLLLLGILEKVCDDPRQPLCTSFMDWLLSDECQERLHLASAFSVTGAASGYTPGDPLLKMDDALRAGGVIAPNAFDGEWPAVAGSIVRKLVAEEGDPRLLWPELAARLSENPNISQ